MSLQARVRLARKGFVLDAEIGCDRGETLAILGPNGAGKSTLLMCIAGLAEPDEARISVDGRLVQDTATALHVPAEGRGCGIVFQGLLLFPHMSVLDNVAFPIMARGLPRSEASRKAARTLDEIGAAPLAGKRPSDLSGGEAQRAALARALSGDPRLLLLDEPLSSLDARARAEVRGLLRTVLRSFEGPRLLVTHEPVEAMTLADRIAVIEEGVITQTGTPAEIRETPRTSYAAELVGQNLFSGRLEHDDGGTGRVVTDEGEIVVAWPAGFEAGNSVLALLPPTDVSIHLQRPEGSPRNVLEGRITSVSAPAEGDRARIRIGSSPPVVADITVGSLSRMGLREGDHVWASFKAVEVGVLPLA